MVQKCVLETENNEKAAERIIWMLKVCKYLEISRALHFQAQVDPQSDNLFTPAMVIKDSVLQTYVTDSVPI